MVGIRGSGNFSSRGTFEALLWTAYYCSEDACFSVSMMSERVSVLEIAFLMLVLVVVVTPDIGRTKDDVDPKAST